MLWCIGAFSVLLGRGDYVLGDNPESERLEWIGRVQPGPVHQFCDEHKRESRTIQAEEE